MTTDQALQLIDKVLARVNCSREDHKILQRALDVLAAACAVKPTQSTSEADQENEK